MSLLAKLLPTRLLYRLGGAVERPATAVERALMLSVPDLQNLGYSIDYEPALETVVARTFPNGGMEVKYTYDPDDQDIEGNHVLLITRAEREPTLEAATSTFNFGLKAYAIGAKLEGSGLDGHKAIRSWATNYFAGYLVDAAGEIRTATVLSVQRHRLVYSVIARGLIAETEDDTAELIHEPALRAIYRLGSELMPNNSFKPNLLCKSA